MLDLRELKRKVLAALEQRERESSAFADRPSADRPSSQQSRSDGNVPLPAKGLGWDTGNGKS